MGYTWKNLKRNETEITKDLLDELFNVGEIIRTTQPTHSHRSSNNGDCQNRIVRSNCSSDCPHCPGNFAGRRIGDRAHNDHKTCPTHRTGYQSHTPCPGFYSSLRSDRTDKATNDTADNSSQKDTNRRTYDSHRTRRSTDNSSDNSRNKATYDSCPSHKSSVKNSKLSYVAKFNGHDGARYGSKQSDRAGLNKTKHKKDCPTNKGKRASKSKCGSDRSQNSSDSW